MLKYALMNRLMSRVLLDSLQARYRLEMARVWLFVSHSSKRLFSQYRYSRMLDSFCLDHASAEG